MLRLNPPKRVVIVLVIVLLSGLVPVHGQTIITLLETARVFDREIQSGEAQVYQFTLAANEHVRVELKSGKARLDLSLLSEKDELITTISEADSPDVKRLEIVAEKATQFFLRVAPERSQTSTAKYQLSCAEKSTATSADRERFALLLLDWEVVSLFRQREKSAFQKSADKAHESAARWRALGDYQQEGRMLKWMGRNLYVLSEYRAALIPFSRAAQAFHDAGDRVEEGRCLFDMAVTHGTLVELSQTEKYHFQAVELWRAINEPELPLVFAYNIGRVYRLTGDWQKAREMFHQLLAAARAYPHPVQSKYYEQQALSELGYTAVGAGQPRLALDYFAQALPSIQADLEHPYNPPFVLDQMARAWLQLGNATQAQELCQQALQSARRIGQRRAEAVALTTLGQVYTALGRRPEAQAALTQAQALNAAMGFKRDQPVTSFRLARLARERGDLLEALQQIEAALAGIDELRAALPPGNEVRATFMANWKDAQAFQLELLMELHRHQPNAGFHAKAFNAAEYAHARLLLELMLESKLELQQNLDPQLLVRSLELQRQITANRNPNELTQLISEYNFVRGQIRQSNPRFAALTQAPSANLSDVQTKLLDENTLLLEYALGEQSSFLFVVSPDELHAFVLPGRKVIETVVRQLYESLSRSGQPQVFDSLTAKEDWLAQNERAYTQSAAQLSALILKPAAGLLGDKRLLIVKDGALNYVPFAALPAPEQGRQGDGGTRGIAPSPRPPVASLPLMLHHEIVSLPSASTLGMLRREEEGHKVAPKILTVIADPVFNSDDERLASPSLQTPARTLFGIGTEPGNFRKLDEKVEAVNEFFPRLPASRHEAEAILNFVPAELREGKLDFEANKLTVTKGNLSQFRYIHFATHGLLDEAHPELSGLMLAGVNREGEKLDGVFTTLDAFDLKLNADLVVLSGCRTALGKEVKGEGLMGLTRGFMYAGARRVMASLWQVNDNATAELMKRFYKGMLGADKLAPAAALRAAQIELWNDKKWKSPYYWAAFTLQGEW